MPGYLSRYSDWLCARRPRVRSSSPSRVKSFLFSTSSIQALGPTQPPTQWVPGALSPGVKRPGREFDHSPPTSAKVKKSGSIHPLSIRLQGQVYIFIVKLYNIQHEIKFYVQGGVTNGYKI
jgi:hypothetical protein